MIAHYMGIRDGTESVGLHRTLEVHQGRHRQHHAGEDEQRRKERVALGIDRLGQGREPRRVAHQLEEAHQSEKREHAQVGQVEQR